MGVVQFPDRDSALGVSVRIGRQPSLRRRLRDRVESFLAAGDLSQDRAFLITRPVICLLVVIAVFLADDLPGRQGVVFGCSIAILYNFGLAFLLLKRRRYLLRAASITCDNLTIIVTSLWAFSKMGHAGYESDLWLVFMVFIITSAMTYGPIGSTMFASLWTGLLVLATLGFYGPDTYFRDQLPMRLAFFVLTGFCAIALSAELRKRGEKSERQTRQTLTMLATIVEARDTDAGLHLKHITHYARALALALDCSEARADEIAYAAMIHDVGKAQVPDAILKKPGALTAGERAEIQKHTIWGHELLFDNQEFETACQVARSHHERWDGTGYPDGLKGEAIPFAARITAVADVYDALTSERSYKSAWPAREAIDEIRRLRGAHFDPDVVDAFLQLYDSGVLRMLETGMSESGPAFDVAA
jgi:HD-GYP domain-containing protein (c-di-GMP phosphodiesterase class II)